MVMFRLSDVKKEIYLIYQCNHTTGNLNETLDIPAEPLSAKYAYLRHTLQVWEWLCHVLMVFHEAA